MMVPRNPGDPDEAFYAAVFNAYTRWVWAKGRRPKVRHRVAVVDRMLSHLGVTWLRGPAKVTVRLREPAEVTVTPRARGPQK